MKNWDIYLAMLLTILSALQMPSLSPLLGLTVSTFIPGYLTILALFPDEKSLKVGERIALSFGISLVVLTILGLLLNSTAEGVTPLTSKLIITFYNVVMAFLAILRRKQSPLPWYPKIKIRLEEKGFDRALTFILLVSLVVALVVVGVSYLLPRPWTTFTELYILNSNGSSEYYPLNLTVNESLTLRIGIVNHESSRRIYNVQIWLANLSRGEIKKLYYLGSFKVSLPSKGSNLMGNWRGEYETNVTLMIPYSGRWQLWFVVANGTYTKGQNYANTSARKIIEGAIEGRVIGVKLNLDVMG